MRLIKIIYLLVLLSFFSCDGPGTSEPVPPEKIIVDRISDDDFYDLMKSLEKGKDTSLSSKTARQEYYKESIAVTDQSRHIDGAYSIVKREWNKLNKDFITFTIKYGSRQYEVPIRITKKYYYKIDRFIKGEMLRDTSLKKHLQITLKPFVNPDSVDVVNIVQFCKYKYSGKPAFDAVKLILRVTNRGNAPIPDIYDVNNRCNYIKGYINGEGEYFMMSLCNGVFSLDGNKTICRDSSQTFEIPWALSERHAGNEFTIQWEYMGIKTKKIKVDLVNKVAL